MSLRSNPLENVVVGGDTLRSWLAARHASRPRRVFPWMTWTASPDSAASGLLQELEGSSGEKIPSGFGAKRQN